MKASPLLLLAPLLMFGCAEQATKTEEAPEADILVADDPTEDVEEDQGERQSPEDPMITFIRTQGGESESSRVGISTLHMSDFPAPHMEEPGYVWDENVSVEVNWDTTPRTQIFSYQTTTSSEEYVTFYSSELGDSSVGSEGGVDIVRGKNEFGDNVEVRITPPSSEGGYAQIQITAEG